MLVGMDLGGVLGVSLGDSEGKLDGTPVLGEGSGVGFFDGECVEEAVGEDVGFFLVRIV